MWFTLEETERPSTSSGQKKKQKMPKKNGFCIFMEERRDSVLAAGHEIPGGKRDLALLLSADWKALSQEERDKYCQKAKQLNERGQRTKSNPVPAHGTVKKPLTNPTCFADEMPAEHKMEIEAGRTRVFQIFRNQNWTSHPIVICNFTLYNEPEYYHDMYVPAEIGLCAMSLENGVTDNYARIIDMKNIPLGRNVEFAQMAKKLGIPAPGTVPEFAEYEPLMMILESFLKKHEGEFEGQAEELHVFAFESDFGVARHCLDWLYEHSGIRLPVKILSLDLYAFLASSVQARAVVKSRSFDQQEWSAPSTDDEECEIVATLSRFRNLGRPLIATFVHPPHLPMTAFGIFLKEWEVDAAIKKMDNYMYFEELCCVYHVKSGQEVQKCALNIANRYAFSLLEILTLSNEVPIKPGHHFPRVDMPGVEIMRRSLCIQRWGISKWEEQMEKCSPELYVEESDPATEEDLKKKPKKWNRQENLPEQGSHSTMFQPRSRAQRKAKHNDKAPPGIEEEDGAVGYSEPILEQYPTLDEQKKRFGRRGQSQIRGSNPGGASSSSPVVEFDSTKFDADDDPDDPHVYRYGGKVPSMFLGQDRRWKK